MLTYKFSNADLPAQQTDGTDSHGFLDLHIQSNSGQDLSGVHVQIIRESNNDLMFDLTTDAGGRVRRVSLPTPPTTNPFGEAGLAFFTDYTVSLTLAGHYPANYPDVSIYRNCITALTLLMYPAR